MRAGSGVGSGCRGATAGWWTAAARSRMTLSISSALALSRVGAIAVSPLPAASQPLRQRTTRGSLPASPSVMAELTRQGLYSRALAQPASLG